MAYSKRPHQITTPDGKTIEYDDERQARMFFGMLLYDNGYCSKPEAQRHGKAIQVGTPHEVPGAGVYVLEPQP